MGRAGDFPIGIGELSRQTNCKVETIRYYERQRLLPEPPRTAGGHRLYTPDMKRRLMFVRRSRELGFSIDEVRGLLLLADRSEISCEHVKCVAEEHLRDIAEKITDLRNMQRTLAEMTSRCSGKDVPDCPIMDVLQDGRSH